MVLVATSRPMGARGDLLHSVESAFDGIHARRHLRNSEDSGEAWTECLEVWGYAVNKDVSLLIGFKKRVCQA